MQLFAKAASSGVDVMPYPKTVHFSGPAGDIRATRAAMRTASSSNPAKTDAIESTIARLTALITDGDMFEYLYPWTNSTIFRVDSSIGPFPP
jgi:hypothetical protein